MTRSVVVRTRTSRSRSSRRLSPTCCGGSTPASRSTGIDDAAPSAGERAGLTERETEILSALAQGLSNQAISAKLWITEQTVKFHLTNIYRKLDVANRTEAARFAFANGLGE